MADHDRLPLLSDLRRLLSVELPTRAKPFACLWCGAGLSEHELCGCRRVTMADGETVGTALTRVTRNPEEDTHG